MHQKIPILLMGELVCVKSTSNICFPSLFNYKVLIIMCRAFFDTLRILKNSIESYHACLNIARVEFFFKIHGQRAMRFLCLWLIGR